SEPGVGSRFSLTLTLPGSASQKAQHTAVHRWHLLPDKRLLIQIVDDESANRDVLARVLRQSGCDLLEAHSVERALQQLETVQPAACFLDIRMPHRSSLGMIGQLRN